MFLEHVSFQILFVTKSFRTPGAQVRFAFAATFIFQMPQHVTSVRVVSLTIRTLGSN